jgi:FAD:protein FMN transferase
MKETRIIMGMPITVAIPHRVDADLLLEAVFQHFEVVDARFSTYRVDSEISRINRGEIPASQWSPQMQEVFLLAEDTHRESRGYFSIEKPDGTYDPSGLVKGWAIEGAAHVLNHHKVVDYFIEAGGDIASQGHNEYGQPWSVGIRNPFNHDEIVRVIHPQNRGIATSGTYIRGQHIWNPQTGKAVETPLISLTVIGENVYDADRFATAAFAMGERGIEFLEEKEGLEAYAIDKNGRATYTSNFERYI